MKMRVVAMVAVATLMLAAASDAQASCFRRGGCGGCVSAPSDCNNCGMTVYSGVPCVTYQPVWLEKDVEVTTYKMVPRTEQFEYNVCTQVVTPEKRKVTVCQLVNKEYEVKYVVNVPVTKPEKRMITKMMPKNEEVEYTYFECVASTTPEKRKVVQYSCVPTVVECDVPCWTTVSVPCCNPCGGVSYTCQRVCTIQKVQRTVMKTVPTEVEVVVNVTTYANVERKGKKTVCKYVAVQEEVTVNVCTYERQERVGKVMRCEQVMVEQEVTVNVCRIVTDKKVGTRTVYDCVPQKSMVKVKYCQMQAVTTMAPVGVPCSTCDTAPRGCFTGCNLGGCFSGHGRGGCNLGSCFSGCRLGGCFSGCR